MSNENSTSSPGIHSSYLYRVTTRLSHVSMRTILCISSHTLLYTCQVPNCYVSICVHHTDIPMSSVHHLHLPRDVTTNSHSCPSMTAAGSWCQKACPRQFMTDRQLRKHPVSLQRPCCYDSPWTGLLTSGDGSCHRWTAVGVRVTPLGRCNINRTIWEQS